MEGIMNFLSKILFGIFCVIFGLFMFWLSFFIPVEFVIGQGLNQIDLTPFFFAFLVFIVLGCTGAGIYFIISAFTDAAKEHHTHIIHGQMNIMNYTCPRCGINLIPGTTICPYCGTRTGGYPTWHGR